MDFTQRRTPVNMQGMDASRQQAAARANAIRDTYRDGVRSKGFRQTFGVGTSDLSLSLSGMAKYFLGIAIHNITAANVDLSLVINEDVVLDTIDARFIEVDGATSPRDFYAFGRALNGQDTITLRVNNGTGGNVAISVIVYYI